MSVRKNLYLAFLQEYSIFFIGFLTSVIIARLLTPNETGVFALSAMFVFVLMQLRQFGMGVYVVQSKDIDGDRAASALGVMYVISWTLGAIIILAAPLIAKFYHEPRLKPALLILSITFFLAPLYQFAMALMERRMDFSGLLKISVVSTLANSIVAVAAARLGLGYLALPFGYLSYTAASLLMVFIMRPEGCFVRPKLNKWRDVVGFGSFTSGAGLVGTIGKQMPEIVLGRLSGVTVVGLYSRASGLIGILQTLIINAITRSFNTSLANTRRQGLSVGADYLNAIALATGLAWSAFALLALVARPLINFLYGAQWGFAAPYLSLLCLHQMFMLSLVAYSEMMTLHGAYKRLFFYELGLMIFALVNFVFWARIDPHYGAAGRVLEGMAFFALYSFILVRLLEIRFSQLFAVYGKSFLLGCVTILPVLITSFSLGWPARMPFWLLTLLGLASGGAWILGLFIVRHPLAPHIRQLLAQLPARFSRKNV